MDIEGQKNQADNRGREQLRNFMTICPARLLFFSGLA